MSEQTMFDAGDVNDGFYEILDARRNIDSAHAELNSLLDVTDSLESLMNHLDQFEVVSVEHSKSLTMSLENLIGSSGLGIADVVPELEGHVNGQVSTESLKGKLNELWKRIVAAILSLLSGIRNLWNQTVTYRGRLEYHAEKLVKQGGAKKLAVAKQNEVSLGIEIKSFIQGSAPLTDGDAVIRALGAALDQYNTFTTTYGKEMKQLGKSFEEVLNGKLSGSEALQATCTIFDKMPIYSLASKMRALAYRDPRFGNRLTMAAPPIMGGWSLFFVGLEKEQQAVRESNILAYSMTLRTTGVKFAYSNAGGFNLGSGTLRTASGAQVQTMALRILDILKSVNRQEKEALSSGVDRQIKDILRAGENYQRRIIDSNGYDQSVLRFARNYASWAMGPVDAMTTNLLTVARSVVIYCNKSLQAH